MAALTARGPNSNESKLRLETRRVDLVAVLSCIVEGLPADHRGLALVPAIAGDKAREEPEVTTAVLKVALTCLSTCQLGKKKPKDPAINRVLCSYYKIAHCKSGVLALKSSQ